MTLIGSLLVESLSDNRVVLRWCHRSVALVASRRYRREIDDIKAAHRDISSLFLDTWLGGALAVERTASLAVVSPLAADRHVAAQPLLLTDTAYNLRRLSELWYQLLNAGKYSCRSVNDRSFWPNVLTA